MELISSSASYSCGEASTLGQNSEKSSMNIEYTLKYLVNINIKEPKYRLNHWKIWFLNYFLDYFLLQFR